MARLAIFIDGGYLDVLARDDFRVWIDHRRLSAEITRTVAAGTAEPLDLLRTYYYDCLPTRAIRLPRRSGSVSAAKQAGSMPSTDWTITPSGREG